MEAELFKVTWDLNDWTSLMLILELLVQCVEFNFFEKVVPLSSDPISQYELLEL